MDPKTMVINKNKIAYYIYWVPYLFVFCFSSWSLFLYWWSVCLGNNSRILSFYSEAEWIFLWIICPAYLNSSSCLPRIVGTWFTWAGASCCVEVPHEEVQWCIFFICRKYSVSWTFSLNSYVELAYISGTCSYWLFLTSLWNRLFEL